MLTKAIYVLPIRNVLIQCAPAGARSRIFLKTTFTTVSMYDQ